MTERMNKETQLISLAVPEEIVRLADFIGESTGQDRCALLLRWLQAGAERETLRMVSAGELSTGKFVELLGISYHDYHPLREKYGVSLECDEREMEYAQEAHSESLAAVLKESRKSQQER